MRKFLKNSILEIFHTIYEAHNQIKIFVNKKNFNSVKAMLIDCQNTAVQIGTVIENSEGKGFATTDFLKDYCEIVYNLSVNISEGNDGDNIQKILDDKLLMVENSVKNDIKVKFEIVFLPYKASMWDSLESIWMAADEDENCNAVVIPIPYFDRTPDGRLGQMHYEGMDYPDYVPVTSWKTYNLADKRPDVIYIHNPYDGNNFVTSVHPAFYSSELKKHTDCLVYVPYFLSSSDNITEGMCNTPVIYNADYIITQSENINNVYKKVFIEAVKANRKVLEKQNGVINREYWEKLQEIADKKFLPLGSPKLDRVNNESLKYGIPKEWENHIYKSDGTKKKVIFYNTSIGALLQNREEYLKKLLNVIRTFAENEEVVLLWRPHPLLQNTFDSMLPHLSATYKALVNEFMANKLGIYDDTPDMNIAIHISDAYYGDESSVVAVYKETGKPIIIQNVSVR